MGARDHDHGVVDRPADGDECERRAPVHRAGTGGDGGGHPVGGDRLLHHDGVAHVDGRRPRRPSRPSAGVPRGRRDLRRGVGGLRRGAHPRPAGRCAVRAGRRRGAPHPGKPRDHQRRHPPRGPRPGRRSVGRAHRHRHRGGTAARGMARRRLVVARHLPAQRPRGGRGVRRRHRPAPRRSPGRRPPGRRPGRGPGHGRPRHLHVRRRAGSRTRVGRRVDRGRDPRRRRRSDLLRRGREAG